MRVLLDTHLLLWSVASSRRLPKGARSLILDAANEVFYSAASVWEVAIKSALRRRDFKADPTVLVRALAQSGFSELPVTAARADFSGNRPGIQRGANAAPARRQRGREGQPQRRALALRCQHALSINAAAIRRLTRRSRRTKALDLGRPPAPVERASAKRSLDVDGVGRPVSGDVNNYGICLGFRKMRNTTRFGVETSHRQSLFGRSARD